MLLARVALAININVASLFQAFTLICRELRNVVKNAFLVLIFWDNKLLVIIFTLLATMVPCQEQQDCKWQTKKMQGSQAGNFRTYLKTHTKTQNPKLLHFFVSRLFILRSCIEFVKIWWLSRQKCWQWLSTFRKFNSVVVSLLREAIAFQIRSFCWTLFKRGGGAGANPC